MMAAMPGPPLSSSFGIVLLRDLAAKRMVEPMTHPPPLGLLAELTHRCPLACPYCSNPLELERRSGELDTATWMRVFEEAAALGVLQLHLSGGEPASRSDLVELVRGAARSGLYTNLITSGIGLDERRLETLAETGLDHIQLSVQHVNAAEADRIAGYAGAHAKKRALARELARIGLPLTINAVIHRANIDAVEALVREAVSLGARRIEVAHSQYYGGALKNRSALIPSADQAAAARNTVEGLRAELQGIIVIDYVAPDYFGRFPKPCMNELGTPVAQRHAVGTCSALPCRRVDSGAHLLVGARPGARRDLGRVARLQRFPRDGLDARTLPVLSSQGDRFRRLPLPGARPHGRRTQHRSGVRLFTGPCACDCGTGRGARPHAALRLQALRCENAKTQRRHGRRR